MRVLVDLKSYLAGAPEIIQVQATPNGSVVVNGKFTVSMPLDVEFPVDSNDYLLNAGNVDGQDITSKGFARLLASCPQYENLYFNPLLTHDHVDELDWDGVFNDVSDPANPVTFKARYQSGRGQGPPDFGQMPSHTALLPKNEGVSPARPGFIVSKVIDIGPYTLDCDGEEAGAKEFMLYWKLLNFTVSHDISGHDLGAVANTNSPALRTMQEIDPEPDGFSAYISTNGGATWCRAFWMAPLVACDPTDSIMVAFRNDSLSKRYLASFAVLF